MKEFCLLAMTYVNHAKILPGDYLRGSRTFRPLASSPAPSMTSTPVPKRFSVFFSAKKTDVFESKPDLCLVSLSELTNIAFLPFSRAAKNEFPVNKRCICLNDNLLPFKQKSWR